MAAGQVLGQAKDQTSAQGTDQSMGSGVVLSGRSGRRPVVALFWLLFLAGLLLQVFAPHLAVEHNTFVIPASATRAGMTVDPRALVMKERAFQAASAALVLVGTVGLAFAYREALKKSLSGREIQTVTERN